ncbi:hypothetical protein B9Q04_09490 [Candidatus Marsarchaeota G2 archaeon BE_D]|jgi:hypothetical protein|uniref:Uncharacterized protein n=6 Tax=Candidatus Marsarchaeota group 2 TaxID=2203771 RepID=A0A2R6C9Z3_9ARCH|nr:MAG: hypothetical protein B9Q08_01345 [Candidatus Marsarchaeota G2 archaeon ECH_B_SAG-M15]PSN95616.1 MAG: hypothetical protein B9Q06_05410 [Candidatus Marsarchaeota G2 archaeon ECH_B_2]PSO00035.1 MAG: hypothetical protein B9Q07_04795 [Candidatus Marsarchaeota G2 archaeon ECH_B_3]PSO02250.1 MAG: hypothetical protein B9Q05_06045 [Candidatus Marsarchaeota G2 archaeon ECH_B_1]PSO07701.1 MAG: hypothetical protein B9Q04_09490 [Candidatus Marsarchaeota G2 archaeon BE_D]
MPYIRREIRPEIDPYVDFVAEEIVDELGGKTIELGEVYLKKLFDVCNTLYLLQALGGAPNRSNTEKLAAKLLEVSKKHAEEGAWREGILGNLNYAFTRLIQVVPKKLVDRGLWKQSMRYWVYAVTAGALEACAHKLQTEPLDHFKVALIGVVNDVKDEYKRRVNAAYEDEQIRKNGDVYDGPYRTPPSPSS